MSTLKSAIENTVASLLSMQAENTQMNGVTVDAKGGDDIVIAKGDNNDINVGKDNDIVFVSGENNTVKGAEGDKTTVVKGKNNEVEYNGDGTYITEIDGQNNKFKGGNGNSSVSINGSNNKYEVGDGEAQYISANGNNNDVKTGDSTQRYVKISGNSNKITSGDGDTTGNINGSSNNVKIGEGSASLSIEGSSNKFEKGDGDISVTINGSSNSIKSGDGAGYIEANGNSNKFEKGDGNITAKISGNSNSIKSGEGAGYLEVNGSSNKFEKGDGDITAIVEGNSNSVKSGDGAVYAKITGSSNSAEFGDGDKTLYLTGDSNTLKAGDGKTYAEINGNSNDIKMGDGDRTVIMNGNSNNMAVGDGDSYVVLQGNSNDLKFGNGNNSIGFIGNNNRVECGDGNNYIAFWGDSNYIKAGNGDNFVQSLDLALQQGNFTELYEAWYKTLPVNYWSKSFTYDVADDAVITKTWSKTKGSMFENKRHYTYYEGEQRVRTYKVTDKYKTTSVNGPTNTTIVLGSGKNTVAVTGGAKVQAGAQTTVQNCPKWSWTEYLGREKKCIKDVTNTFSGRHLDKKGYWYKDGLIDIGAIVVGAIVTYCTAGLGLPVAAAIGGAAAGLTSSVGKPLANGEKINGKNVLVSTAAGAAGGFVGGAAASGAGALLSTTAVGTAGATAGTAGAAAGTGAAAAAGSAVTSTASSMAATAAQTLSAVWAGTAAGNLASQAINGEHVSWSDARDAATDALSNPDTYLSMAIGAGVTGTLNSNTQGFWNKTGEFLYSAGNALTFGGLDTAVNAYKSTEGGWLKKTGAAVLSVVDSATGNLGHIVTNIGDYSQRYDAYKEADNNWLTAGTKAIFGGTILETPTSIVSNTAYGVGKLAVDTVKLVGKGIQAVGNGITSVVKGVGNLFSSDNKVAKTDGETVSGSDEIDLYEARDNAKSELNTRQRVVEMAQEDLRTAQRELTRAKDAYNADPKDTAKKQAYEAAVKEVKQAESFLKTSQQNLKTAQTNWKTARAEANNQTWYGKISNGIESGINYLNDTFKGSILEFPVKAVTTVLSLPGEVIRFATDNNYGWGSDMKYTAQNMFTKQNNYGLNALYEWSGLKTGVELANNTVGLILGKKLALENTVIGEKWNTVIDSDYSIMKGLKWVGELFSPSQTTKDSLASAKERMISAKNELNNFKKDYRNYVKDCNEYFSSEGEYKSASFLTKIAAKGAVTLGTNMYRLIGGMLQENYDAAVRNYRQYTALGQISNAVNDGINGLLNSTRGTIYSLPARVLANTLTVPGAVLKFATNNGYGWGKDVKYTAQNMFTNENLYGLKPLYEWSGAKVTVETLNNTAGLLIGSKFALSSAKGSQTWNTIVDADSIWNKLGRAYDNVKSYFTSKKTTTSTVIKPVAEKSAAVKATQTTPTASTGTLKPGTKIPGGGIVPMVSLPKSTNTAAKTNTTINPIYAGNISAISQNVNSNNYNNMISRINLRRFDISKLQTI